MHIRRELLDRPVRTYADKLQAELQDMWRSRGVHTLDDFKRLAREKKIPEVVVRKYRDLTAHLVEVVRSGKLPEDAVAPEIWEIMERERTALIQFFGRDFDVPPPPPEVTPELLEFWTDNLFTIRYLPKIKMARGEGFPGWKQEPSVDFYEVIQRGVLSAEALVLPGCWLLVDERQKPNYQVDGLQRYNRDELIETTLSNLQIGLHSLPASDSSRFGRCWDDLQDETVLKAMSKSLHLPSGSVRLPRLIEWNFLANTHYQAWGNTDTAEWFEDWAPVRLRGMFRNVAFFGGNVHHGGI